MDKAPPGVLDAADAESSRYLAWLRRDSKFYGRGYSKRSRGGVGRGGGGIDDWQKYAKLTSSMYLIERRASSDAHPIHPSKHKMA